MHNLQNNKLCFSHRPVARVSVGAYSEDGVIYIAASFANDGLSRSGRFHKERCDAFSRPAARKIISGRINDAREAYRRFGRLTKNNFTMAIKSDMTTGDFMGHFRSLFKPDPYEQDLVLTFTTIPALWEEISELVYDAVA